MSKRELNRKTLIEAYIYGKLTLGEVAIHMKVGYRQAKRILRRYKQYQNEGLIHRGRGRRPTNALSDEFKAKVLTLYQAKYFEFGPTYAAEKLDEDDGVQVNPETLRLWLKAEGLWHRRRKHKIYRERRERKPCFGELLQIDGSIHRWFANDETHYCLLNIVDDATGISLAKLDKGETTKVLLDTFRKWIETYGIPKAAYVDLKSVYVSAKHLKEKYDDDLLVQEGFSVFEQVCKALNIAIIRAYSPQAKGRVERKHAVYQDRLVKDLKLYDIKTIDAANTYLEEFIKKINKKFAKPKEAVPDCHREADSYGDLNEIICWKYKRQIRNDWTIQFNRTYYQIKKGYEQLVKPEDFIIIKRYLDGAMRFWHNEIELQYEVLKQKPDRPPKKKYYKLKGPEDPVKKRKRLKEYSKKSPWRLDNPYLKTG